MYKTGNTQRRYGEQGPRIRCYDSTLGHPCPYIVRHEWPAVRVKLWPAIPQRFYSGWLLHLGLTSPKV